MQHSGGGLVPQKDRAAPGMTVVAVSAPLISIDANTMKAEDLERLVTQTMPYGKYKGRLIADLPGNYLNWFARVGFPPDSLGQLLALMHEIDHNGLSALLEPLRRRNAARG